VVVDDDLAVLAEFDPDRVQPELGGPGSTPVPTTTTSQRTCSPLSSSTTVSSPSLLARTALAPVRTSMPSSRRYCSVSSPGRGSSRDSSRPERSRMVTSAP
jgi:hypothetical protein